MNPFLWLQLSAFQRGAASGTRNCLRLGRVANLRCPTTPTSTRQSVCCESEAEHTLEGRCQSPVVLFYCLKLVCRDCTTRGLWTLERNLFAYLPWLRSRSKLPRRITSAENALSLPRSSMSLAEKPFRPVKFEFNDGKLPTLLCHQSH